MKIYDCFSYWDEDLLLDIRLNILNDYVDYFVIVESSKTHGKIIQKNFNLILIILKNLKIKSFMFQLKICLTEMIPTQEKTIKETVFQEELRMHKRRI